MNCKTKFSYYNNILPYQLQCVHNICGKCYNLASIELFSNCKECEAHTDYSSIKLNTYMVNKLKFLETKCDKRNHSEAIYNYYNYDSFTIFCDICESSLNKEKKYCGDLQSFYI